MTPQQLREALTRFTGTEHYYRHWIKGIVFTDGVKFLAEHAGACWLIDAIASYQHLQKLRTPKLREFQLWRLAVADDKSARLTCRADSDEPAIVVQRIEYTDFPLDSITLYVENGVLLLPSEH